YIGWAFDKFGYEDPGADVAVIISLMQQVGEAERIPPDAETYVGPEQLIRFMTAFVAKFIEYYPPTPEQAGAIGALMDSDVSNSDVISPYGNGDSGTIYRLREGVERFMITDINNPGASAMAQSTLPLMFDHIAVAVTMFNHVPGGSNVLFMDGHVEFQRYEERGSGLANSHVAHSLGLMALAL
ncbi:MAG TPA: hypothetical protein ENN29_10575, partial [Candidatus Hydrogenedentes bacterium]|nr:hypothetical protein [Candidatus Hydrogenedentota bacterium]